MGTEKKDVSHMFDGLDDVHPAKRLCRGYIDKAEMHQSHRDLRMLDTGDRIMLPTGGGITLDLSIRVVVIDSEVAQAMTRGEVEILIRRTK